MGEAHVGHDEDKDDVRHVPTVAKEAEGNRKQDQRVELQAKTAQTLLDSKAISILDHMSKLPIPVVIIFIWGSEARRLRIQLNLADNWGPARFW